MLGKFNGLELTITSLSVLEKFPGMLLTTFSVHNAPAEFKGQLQLDSPALLILPVGRIEGRIGAFSEDPHQSYEVTIEGRQ